MKLKAIRFIVSILIIAILTPLFYVQPQCLAIDKSNSDNSPVTLDISKSYNSYIAENADAISPDQQISIPASDYASSSYTPNIKENYEGMQGKSIITNEDGYVEWTVNIRSAGFYNIGVDYYPIVGKSSSAVRMIWIDGKLPFEEARNITFSRVWSDVIKNGKSIVQDANGNDIRPEVIEKPIWLSTSLHDSIGYINDSLKFYFSEGIHSIRFIAIKEPMLMHLIRLFQDEPPLSYNEVKKEYDKKDYQTVDCPPIKFQAEDTNTKSDPMIVPVFDRSTSATEPSDPAKLRLNAIGADKMMYNGQWATWSFSVPKTGLYKIGIKSIQNWINGAISSRKIFINGKVPFKELNAVGFPYSSSWNMVTLGGDNEPYEFYFEAGKIHEIKFEVTLGNMSDILQEVNDITNKLNAIYRKILIVTGPTPDVNRDYQFDVIMPDVISDLQTQSQRLQQAFNEIVKRTGMNGENVQILRKLYMQMDGMYEKPQTIAERFSAFQGNTSALGSWIMTTKQQPLTIDYFIIAPKNAKMPNPTANFLDDFVYQIRSFISTFFEDYNSISYGEKENSITVWVGNGVTGGRDQAQVLKIMSDNYFTNKSGINVNLQLVAMGSLLPATLSGQGPDVALTLASSEAMNYAFRNAAVDLAKFSDYSEIAKRFSDSALVPLTFEKGVYGLPESQTFLMLFYRKDIMAQLKLSVPQTWDDVINILPVLQKKQLNFGLPSAIGAIGASMTAFSMLLFQNNGHLYTEDGGKSVLDSDASINTFSFLTSLYNDYQLPKVLDFVNRFRVGSVPIGIADYSTYNQLSVFAPELNGIWDFTSIPGIKKADGTIDRSDPCAVSTCIILSKSKNQKSAWEYLKWWTSADIQVKFGRELESIMGTAARYPTANLEALYQIPWSKTNFDKLMEQWKSVKGIPEVPGGYYTPRYIDFAFRDVVNNSSDTGQAITNAAKAINNEIQIKRKEFGLSN